MTSGRDGRRACVTIAFALLALGAAATASRAEDSLDTARDLYVSAAYEDALAVLDRLASSPQPADGSSIERYKAICLLALGRTSEAELVIERLVTANPSYTPPAPEESPRVRVVFSDVRRRVLPAMIQQDYSRAKTAYDRHDYQAAKEAFDGVVRALADPDLGPAVEKPPLADLQLLASGFRDLTIKALESPPAPPTPAVAAPPPPVPPVEPAIYFANSPSVTPPVPITQVLPPFPGIVPAPLKGTLEVIVSEDGRVESAVMRGRVTPAYDKLVLASVVTWTYRPATLDGMPVKFRKFISINVGARER